MRMLCLLFSIFGKFWTPPIGLEYELQRFQSFSVDPYGCKYSWNNAEEDGRKKGCFRPCGQPLGLPIWHLTRRRVHFFQTPLLCKSKPLMCRQLREIGRGVSDGHCCATHSWEVLKPGNSWSQQSVHHFMRGHQHEQQESPCDPGDASVSLVSL